MQDPNFVQDLLKSIDLDPNDPELKKEIEKLQKGEKKEEDKK